MARLEAHQLVKRYKGRTVVDSVSVSLDNGEIVGLLGPNGAGKTTSFYLIVGLIAAEAGEIRLDGRQLTHLPMHKRARLGLGYLPQEASVFRKLTVADNILAILELRKNLTKAERFERLDGLLAEFHISHLCDHLGISLSGGERRRVEIARALATDPSFILLDEPFAGVDPISVVDIKTIIQQLSDRKIGVLITDHNVRETLDICHRAYILSDGKIIASGNTEAILTNQRVRQVYLGEAFEI